MSNRRCLLEERRMNQSESWKQGRGQLKNNFLATPTHPHKSGATQFHQFKSGIARFGHKNWNMNCKNEIRDKNTKTSRRKVQIATKIINWLSWNFKIWGKLQKLNLVAKFSEKVKLEKDECYICKHHSFISFSLSASASKERTRNRPGFEPTIWRPWTNGNHHYTITPW